MSRIFSDIVSDVSIGEKVPTIEIIFYWRLVDEEALGMFITINSNIC